ncbi:hypothetical protein HYH03_002222 [Edaphochlamys debaryana]|uniref:Tectonic-1-3 N-terminal domain-containing protein n=1 Tax=Edaphochlamys debaryana TaxID=47281 RepID=A0A835YBK4_9CHLO|nr:hypothetical protein HYH03_002222 [Edaphochlamys debaryana]|eukprot:KAG2499935.1 hypothetical protein HYH03_002222 [Edaphochlamys debaryana]
MRAPARQPGREHGEIRSIGGDGRRRRQLLRHCWPLAALLVVLAVVPTRVGGQVTPLQTFYLDWDNVPTTPPTSKNLTANCNCDLREQACDVGCCCDPLCPSGLNELFTDEGICLPQGPDQPQITYCVPNDAVVKVNLPSNSDFYVIVKQAADVAFWSELLCIADDSNPSLGDNYPDPPVGPVGDNQNLAQCPPAQSPPLPATQYQFMSYVFAQLPNATTVPLTVPYPAFSAECSNEFILGFLLSVPVGTLSFYQSCQRDLTQYNPASVCSSPGLLSPQFYSQLRFLTGRGSSVTPGTFTVVKTQFLDPATGNLTDLGVALPSSSFSAGVCRNIVRYMNMTFFYTLDNPAAETTPGYIDAIELTFVLTDFTVSNTPFTQGVRVAWLETQVPQPVEVIASGNPGYLTGWPVLAGALTQLNETGRTAISQFVGGMPIPMPAMRGSCDPTALGSVRYGTNITTTCSYTLTPAQLADFCVNQANTPEKYVRLALGSMYDIITTEQLQVGIWGNSELTNVNQWLQVELSGYPFSAPIYSESSRACSGVITGFDLQVVTGVAFSSNNLQQKVLYAQLCFKTGVWEYSSTLMSQSSMRFYLNFTASFIRIPQQAETTKKPAPPLVVPLPYNIFYPFLAMDSAGSAVAPSVWALVLALVASLGLALMRA